MSDTPVRIYTKPTCGFCIAAKNLLTQKNIAFTDTDISNNDTLRNELIAQTGHRTVPIVFVQGKFIGGFDDLQALAHTGELDTLLTQ